MTDEELNKLDQQVEEIVMNLFLRGKDHERLVFTDFNPTNPEDQGLKVCINALKGALRDWNVFVQMPWYKFIFYKIFYQKDFQGMKLIRTKVSYAINAYQFRIAMCNLFKDPNIFITINNAYGRRANINNG